MVKKPSAPSTPQQTKSTFKIQSEQRPNAKQNKNKRKSLPANLINSNGSTSPKKPKVEPFSGTSDLFMQMKQEPEIKIENTKVESIKQENNDSKPNSGSRAKRRREKLKARREAGKQKLKQTLVDATTGNQAAIARLKERVSELQKKDVLSSAAKRKLKKLRKVLKDAGITLPSKPETINKQNSNKAANKTTQKGKEIKTEGIGNKNQKKVVKQEKKPQIKKELEIKKEPESDEESDSETAEEEEETDDSILDSQSKEEEEDSDEVEGSENSEETEEEEGEEESGGEEEEESGSEEDEDSSEDEDEKPEIQKGKPVKQPQTKKIENQANNVSSLEKSKSRYVVFVGNLPFDITKEEISEHFAKIGNVKDIRIPLDKQTNKCRGFAYVELLNQASYEVTTMFVIECEFCLYLVFLSHFLIYLCFIY